MAGKARPAIPGNRHKDGQTESIGRTAEFDRNPPGERGTARVLGRNRPGSEGNLASDSENTPPVNIQPRLKRNPKSRQPVMQPGHRRATPLPPRNRRRSRRPATRHPLGTLRQPRRLQPPKRSSAQPNVRPNGPSAATREKAAADRTIVTAETAAETRASAASTVAAAP